MKERLKMFSSEDQRIWKKTKSLYKRAYAPYSKFPVGAVLVSQDEKFFEGVNVENGVNGVSICAERIAICNAVTAGYKKFKAICVVAPTKIPTYPCGVCLQSLVEFCSPKLKILIGNEKKLFATLTLKDLYPRSYDLRDYKALQK